MPVNSAQSSKTPTQGSMTILTILKGILISYIITIPIFCVFALVLTNTDFPEKFTSPVVLITTIISILTAGSTSTKGMKSRGWLNGSIVGFVYIFILYLASSIIFKNFNVDRYVITMAIIAVLTGAIGGILGINLKKSTHKHKH